MKQDVTLEKLPVRDPLTCLMLDGTLHAVQPSWNPNRVYLRMCFEDVFFGLLGKEDRGCEYLCSFNIWVLCDSATGKTWDFVETGEQEAVRAGGIGEITLKSKSPHIPWLAVDQTVTTSPAEAAVVVETVFTNEDTKPRVLRAANLLEVALPFETRNVSKKGPTATARVYSEYDCRYYTVALAADRKGAAPVSTRTAAQSLEDEDQSGKLPEGVCYTGLRWDEIKLEPNSTLTVRYAVAVSRVGEEEAVDRAAAALKTGAAASRKHWAKGIEKYPAPPPLKSGEALRAWYYSHYCLDLNRHDLPLPGNLLASVFYFRSIWLWDMALGLRGVTDQPWVTKPVDLLLENQIYNGRIPIWIHGDGATQPPIIARTIWEIYADQKNREWLETVYPRLLHYNKWIRSSRLNKVGLFDVGGGGETGMDNSPVYDRDLRKNPRQRVANVHMSSCYYGYLVHLVKIARELGDDYNADRLEVQASDLKRAIQEYSWNEKAGWFYATLHEGEDHRKFTQIKIKASKTIGFKPAPGLKSSL